MNKSDKDNLNYFYDYNIDINTRTLYFGYGQVDSDVELDHKLSSEMLKGLHLLNSLDVEDGEPIQIIMNCSGGDVDHGLAIYDAIRSSPSQVIITVTGLAYSMAAWVLQAADRRYITENSSIMIHDGDGPKDKWTKKQDIRCRDILLERIREKNPDYTLARLQRLLDTDTYLTAKEALELGLVDRIV